MREKHIKWSIILTLAIVCILGVGVSKPVKAEDYGNTTMEMATPITIGETVKITFHKDVKEFLYYKLTIPEDVGNQWINFTISSYLSGSARMVLCDEQDKTLKSSGYVGKNNSTTFRTRIEGSAVRSSVITLSPGATYYLELDKSSKSTYGDCVISVNSVSDDNWGTFEKAQTISCNQLIKGKLEYSDDIDGFVVVLPNDKKKYTFVLSANHSIYALFADSNTIKIGSTTVSRNNTNNSFSLIGSGQKIYVRIETNGYYSFEPTDYTLKVVGDVVKQTISKFRLTKYKRNAKTIKGKTISYVTVKLRIKGKTYKVKSKKDGTFIVKLKKKLKKNSKIKVTVSKANYITRTITYTVK